MKTALFDFNLPDELIASAPANPRDAARMLVVADESHDSSIQRFVDVVRPDDVVVLNDTKVIPARLYGRRDTAKIEILLHKQTEQGWLCFAKPAKRLKVENTLVFADAFEAEVVDKHEDGQVVLRFNQVGDALYRKLEQHGRMPLPPYIEKKRHADHTDNTHYQTVFAKHEGSVAAPTAGLHFTSELLGSIRKAGATIATVTLHVGGGTFLPVKTDDTDDHKMHSEWAHISKETVDQINNARKAGGRVIAVGTTALRTLESATDKKGILRQFDEETDIFITPGYQFKAVDILLTNFHLPRSTLFMLVCAFAGTERMKMAYAHAMTQKYRFYSYGDACLLYAQA